MGFKNWLKRARLRQEVKIDQSLWLRLKNSRCFYCSVEPHLLPLFYSKLKLNRTPWMTIDRKENDKGYTPENVVSCCFNCNRIKGSFFSSEEMLFIAEKIIKPKLQKYNEEVWEEFVDNIPLMDDEVNYDTEISFTKRRR